MKIKSALFAMLTIFLMVSFASAQMEVHPYLTAEQEYNDNINLTANGEEDDWVTTLQPGFSFLYDERSVDATINYSLEYIFYNENSEDNQDKFKDIQRADASIRFFSGRPFTLTITENISREALDEEDVFSPDNSRINMTTVYATHVSPEYRWQMTPTFSLVLGYEYNRTDYIDSRGADSQEHQGRLSLVKLLSESLDLSANYNYSLHETDETDADFAEESLTVGLTYRLSSRTQFAIEGGLTEVEYDQGGESHDQTTWQADLSWQVTQAMLLSLIYSQDFSSSATQGLSHAKESALAGTYQRDQFSISGELFWSNSDYLRQNREDTAYGVRADFSRKLSRFLTFGIDGEYEWADFDAVDGGSEVDRWFAGTFLNLEYRRFVASLNYRYRVNEADVAADDYVNNTVTLSLSVRF